MRFVDDQKKNRLFFLGLLVVLGLSVGVTYVRYVTLEDYFVLLKKECDPAMESCFLYVCDPEAEECSEDPEENANFFSERKIKARYIESCREFADVSKIISCLDEKEDETIFCDPENIGDLGECYGPGMTLEEKESFLAPEDANGEDAAEEEKNREENGSEGNNENENAEEALFNDAEKLLRKGVFEDPKVSSALVLWKAVVQTIVL